jgi:hypothetical protein
LLTEARQTATSGLPGGVAFRSALTSALHYSVLADDAYIVWGEHIRAYGCGYRYVNSASLRAIHRYDRYATEAKQQVARLWGPIADQFGLRYYSDAQI